LNPDFQSNSGMAPWLQPLYL